MAPTKTSTPRYQCGFGNGFATEALAGALPVARNSPQRCAYGLYAEQLTGSAFTAPRADNRRSWLYRIRPAATHGPFQPLVAPQVNADFGVTSPNALRWQPRATPTTPTDFVDGLFSLAGQGGSCAAGASYTPSGASIYLYAANQSMAKRAFYSADGEWLIVLQRGRQRFVTELGVIDAEPQEVVVIPRGVRFRVELLDELASGYVCENHGAPFRLPDLGPIGANGLASPRDFLTPEAAYEDIESPHALVAKFMGRLWSADMGHSPFDVVAWHGNYAPYKYDLRRFNAIGSISFDHPDPSIFLVLHSPSATPGVSDIDFAIFGPRLLVAQNTFRPPWFHRNLASEFMGLVHGVYDAKAEGFLPGGSSLHNCMTGHGPDAATVDKARDADTYQPQAITDTMAFMFETRCVLRATLQALAAPELQASYQQVWQHLPKRFTPTQP